MSPANSCGAHRDNDAGQLHRGVQRGLLLGGVADRFLAGLVEFTLGELPLLGRLGDLGRGRFDELPLVGMQRPEQQSLHRDLRSPTSAMHARYRLSGSIQPARISNLARPVVHTESAASAWLADIAGSVSVARDTAHTMSAAALGSASTGNGGGAIRCDSGTGAGRCRAARSPAHAGADRRWF